MTESVDQPLGYVVTRRERGVPKRVDGTPFLRSPVLYLTAERIWSRDSEDARLFSNDEEGGYAAREAAREMAQLLNDQTISIGLLTRRVKAPPAAAPRTDSPGRARPGY